MLLDEVDELLVSDRSRTHDNHVLTEVVSLMEVSDHFSVDLADVIDVSENRLAHHVFPVDVEIDILHEGLLGVLVRGLELLPDRVFLILEVIVVIDAVADHVAEDFD